MPPANHIIQFMADLTDTEQKRLHSLALSDTGFLFDPITGHTYTLNRSGCDLLRLMRDGVAEGELATRLAKKYDVTEAEAERDCQQFLRQLRDYRLLD